MRFKLGEEFKSPLEAFNGINYGDKIKIKGGSRFGVVTGKQLVIHGSEEKISCHFNAILDGMMGWTLKWDEIVKL